MVVGIGIYCGCSAQLFEYLQRTTNLPKMESTIKQRLVKASKWFALVFLLLFLFRLGYGYLESAGPEADLNAGDFFSSVENLRKNYASENKMSNQVIPQQQQSFAAAQKYEKTASVKTRTAQFDKDEKQIKSFTENYKGVIQFEKNTGKQGHREIHLSIGIDPAKFDSFYLTIQSIGAIRSREITKVDKTNDYLQLNAKKASFDTTLRSLNELKKRSGAISDYVALHEKILEVQQQMQELGVELGNFDAVNEFCTVQFSLYEGKPVATISFLHRVKVALEWTIRNYAYLVFGYLAFIIAAFITLLALDKIKGLIKLT
jgi:hypothetical protein